MNKMIVCDSNDNIVLKKLIKGKINNIFINTNLQKLNFSLKEEDRKNKNINKEEIENVTNSKLSSKDLNDMFADNDFWNL